MQEIKVNSSKYENRFEKRSFNVSRSQQNLAKTINCLVCTLYKFTSRQQWIVCRSKYFLFLLPSKEDAFLIPQHLIFIVYVLNKRQILFLIYYIQKKILALFFTIALVNFLLSLNFLCSAFFIFSFGLRCRVNILPWLLYLQRLLF